MGSKRRFLKNTFPGNENGRLCLSGHYAQPHLAAEQDVDSFLD